MFSVFDKGRFPPCPTPFNMAAHVLGGGLAAPDKVALQVIGGTNGETFTFARIERIVLGLAASYREAGLKAGDRILLRLGNSPMTPFAYLAAIAVDMIPIPASTQLTAPEIAQVIEQLAPRMILHDTSLPCPDHPARVEAKNLEDMAATPPAYYSSGPPDRPAYIVYTSGTSGQPRAVVHAHRAIWARQMMIRHWYDLHHTDRMLHAGAFNWTYTMGTGLMDPWSVGATALIPADGTSPGELAPLISAHKATLFAAAPGVFRKALANRVTLNAPDLRHGLSAGEKMSPTIAADWSRATGTQVHEAYGMSECSTFISASPAQPAKAGAIGAPQAGRQIAILDADGQPCPRGKPGTIGIRRTDPGLMLGYLDAPEETAGKFSGDWFVTGDRAVLQQDDQITYLGRDDDMMNAGGYRVSPLEVEATLAGLPDIGQIAVKDIDVKQDVRIIVAFFTGPARAHDLASQARDRLAAYKCPRDWIHVPQLPTGPNGKLLRKDLATLWRAS